MSVVLGQIFILFVNINVHNMLKNQAIFISILLLDNTEDIRLGS